MQATKLLSHLSPAIVAGLLLLPLCTMAQKKCLLPEEYGRWHNYTTGPVSADGKWNAYTIKHPGSRDTLYLKNIDTSFQYCFPSATDAKLTTDGKWMAMRRNDSLKLLDVRTGRITEFGPIKSHVFSADDRYLIAHFVSKTLLLNEIYSGTERKIENVKEFAVANGGIAVTVTSGDSSAVRLIKIGNDGVKTIAVSANNLSGIRWNTTATAFAFYETVGDSVVKLHSFSDRLGHKTFDVVASLPHGATVLKKKLYLSDDGERLFFDAIQNIDKNTKAPRVEIFNGSAAELTFGQENTGMKPYWHVVWTDSGKHIAIESDEFKTAVLTGDTKFALLRSDKKYKPVHKFGARYQDIYLKDLATGQLAMIIKKISIDTGTVVVSPGGKHIAYYKDGNWWSYELATGKYRCLTKNSNSLWEGNDTERRGNSHVYGCAGWSEHDSDILLYSQYDIWKYPLPGGNPSSLTDGLKKKVRYRIIKEDLKPSLREGSLGFTSENYSLDKGLLFKMEEPETGREGLALWNPSKGTTDLALKDRKILSAKRCGNGARINAIESAFDISPRWFQTGITGTEREIAQANKQQKEYAWGRSELIRYDLNGKKIKAVLCYPAGFDPTKKYPMVVHIYEKMASRLHDYDYPDMQNSIGFNRTNLTLDGYFVLMPDLEYKINKVGTSALNGVKAAVETVVNKGFVDKERIALIGHSFGGFETAYIASQGSIFRTAIVGSGVYDLKAYYLGTDTSGISNMERFWHGQFRNTIPFEKPEFENESPLNNVEGINIPLLIWTGDSDDNVPYSHSTQLHAALWKLRKESTLLVYRNEAHILDDPEKRKDLTKRISEWLDYYLKGSPRPSWIK